MQEQFCNGVEVTMDRGLFVEDVIIIILYIPPHNVVVSSLQSPQSFTPSHFTVFATHLLFVHLNCAAAQEPAAPAKNGAV